MATELTKIQEIIERSIYEAIRLEVVSQGYLPDIAAEELDGDPPVLVPVYPNNQTGWDRWKEDVETIKNSSKGFVIEVFSGGTNQSRGVKKAPRIIMDPGNFLPGALGGDPLRFFSDQGDHYKALVTPPQTVDFYQNICLVCDSIAQQRIINAIMALAVPRRGYLKFYNDPTKSFFINFLNFYQQSSPTEGFIEFVYAYGIPDAWDKVDTPFSEEEIAKMVIIELHPNVQKYMDGSWGHNADPIIVAVD